MYFCVLLLALTIFIVHLCHVCVPQNLDHIHSTFLPFVCSFKSLTKCVFTAIYSIEHFCILSEWFENHNIIKFSSQFNISCAHYVLMCQFWYSCIPISHLGFTTGVFLLRILLLSMIFCNVIIKTFITYSNYWSQIHGTNLHNMNHSALG